MKTNVPPARLTAGTCLRWALLLLVLLFALPAQAAVIVNKLGDDDIVLDTVQVNSPALGDIAYVLTTKKIIAVDRNGDVIAELSGLLRARAITGIGHQIFVVGSTAATGQMDLRKYRLDPTSRKIEYIGQSDTKPTAENDGNCAWDLLIYGPEVWAINNFGSGWNLYQYTRGGDGIGDAPKIRTPRTPNIGSTDRSFINQVTDSSPHDAQTQFKMVVDPNDSSRVYFSSEYRADNRNAVWVLNVSNTGLTRRSFVILDGGTQFDDIPDLLHDGEFLWICSDHDLNGLRLERFIASDIARDKSGQENTEARNSKKMVRIKRKSGTESLGLGGIAVVGSELFVTVPFGAGNLGFFNASDVQEGGDLSGAVGSNYAVARLNRYLDSTPHWTGRVALPKGQGAGGVADLYNKANAREARAHLASTAPNLLLFGTILNTGSALFDTGVEIKGKAAFDLTMDRNLALVDRAYLLTIRAERKDPTNASSAQPLNFPSGEAAPGLGGVFTRQEERVTIKMPDAVYQRKNGSFLALAGKSPETIEAEVRHPDVIARYTPVGYTVTRDGDPQTVTGDGSSVTVVMTRNTTVSFHFRREFALSISSRLAGLPGVDPVNGQSLGTPNPPAQKHWIRENELVSPQIDGVVTSLTDGGTRYLTTGYAPGGVIGTTTVNFTGNQARQQVKEFTMSNWASIEYLWKTQHSITISTSSTATAGLPAVQTAAETKFGTRTEWFDRGATLTVGATDDVVAGNSLRSVLNATGALASISGKTRTELTDSFTTGGKRYLGKRIDALNDGATVSWEFGNTIYRVVVPLGSAVGAEGVATGTLPLAPKHRWSFNGSTADAIAGANASLQNGAVFDPTNKVVLLPSTERFSHIQLPANLVGSKRFMYELWATPTTSGGLILGKVRFRVSGDGTPQLVNTQNTPIGSGPAVPLNVRHQYVVAVDLNTESATVYVDGVRSFSCNVLDQGSPLSLGLGFQEVDNARGSIDEFRIFNTILPEQEIATLFALGPDAPHISLASGRFPSSDALPSAVGANIDRSVPPTVVSVLNSPPGTTADMAFVWSAFERKAYPVRPGRYLLEWKSTVQNAKPITTEVTSGFPGDRVRHPYLDTAGIQMIYPGNPRHHRAVLHEAMPAIDLDPSAADLVAFKQLAFSSALDPVSGTDRAAEQLAPPVAPPVVAGKSLTFPVTAATLEAGEGKHVLVFSQSTTTPATGDFTREGVIVRVLETRKWNASTEWTPTTPGATKKFKYYRFIPLQTYAGEVGIADFTLIETGGPSKFPQKRSAPKAVAKLGSSPDPGRMFDGDLNTYFSDVSGAANGQWAPIEFTFANAEAIDSFRFTAAQTELATFTFEGQAFQTLPLKRWRMEASNDQAQWVTVFEQSVDYPPVRGTETFRFNNNAFEAVLGPMLGEGGNATIGTKLADARYDTAAIGTGFVTGAKARFNVNVYDRSRVALAGPIFPVNRHFAGGTDDELNVVWYERVDGILWPWKPARYTAQWPANPRRIVIASQLGSDGLNATRSELQPKFDPATASDLQIYAQNDPALPGFNPNEEHALVAGSAQYATEQPQPSAVYALRNDLNITAQTANHTSEPFALAQFTNTTTGETEMAVYRVETSDGFVFGFGEASSNTQVIKTGNVTALAGGEISVNAPQPFFAREAVEVRITEGVIDGISSGQTLYVLDAGKTNFRLARTPFGDPITTTTATGDLAKVALTLARLYPYEFSYRAIAGRLVPTPNPLTSAIGAVTPSETSGGDSRTFTDATNPAPKVYYEDHKGTPWVISGDGARFFTRFFYRMQAGFWHKRKADGTVAGTSDAGTQSALAAPIAWLPTDAQGTIPRQVSFAAEWPEDAPVLKVGETLTFAGGEFKADRPAASGLPGVIGFASGRVVFDSLNPAMDKVYVGTSTNDAALLARQRTFTNYAARLISPLETRSVSLAALGFDPGRIAAFKDKIQPSTGIVEIDGLEWKFTQLPASLKGRIFFDPIGNRLGIRGYVNDKTLGDQTLTAAPSPAYILDPNILRQSDLTTLKNFKANRAEDLTLAQIIPMDWTIAVDALFARSRNPANLRKDSALNTDASAYYTGLDWAPQRDANGNVLKFGANGTLPVGAVAADIPTGYVRVEGQPVPTKLRAAPASLLGPGLALVPSPHLLDPIPFEPVIEPDPAIKNLIATKFNGPDATLYVTVAENDDPAIGGPVSMHVIKFVKRHRYRGAIRLVEGSNAFSEKVTLRHTGDFGGNTDDLVFEWFYRPEDGRNYPWPYKDGSTLAPWQVFPGATSAQVDVEGRGQFILPDLWFFARFRHINDKPANATWSGTSWERQGKPDADVKKGELWAGAANSPQPNGDYLAQLVPGWLKRVLDRINPYEARFTDFRLNGAPATYASMIQQAGQRYTGPVALNPNKDVIENTGLLALYQTLLERAGKFSIATGNTPITDPALKSGVMNALQLASTRVQDLYMVLANEAYADSQDPLVGFGSDSAEYGTGAASIWAFMNQTATPLDEELQLLRGGSFDFGVPVHNRMFWNFTKDLGEVAYAQTYNLTDENGDGFVNESDAQLQFPQGHGDAWGHYSTAVKMHYDLLSTPLFEWQPRSEFYNLLSTVIPVDFYDERKFAFAAASRARAGADTVSLTYRQRYTENPDGQWQGYFDVDTDRAWGVQEWARRAGQAALCDWAVANSLLPARAENRGDARNIARVTTSNGGQSYLVELAANVTLPKQDAVANAIRYLLVVNPPAGDPQEIVFQPDGVTQSQTLVLSQVANNATQFTVSFAAGSPINNLTVANFSLAVYDRPEGIAKVDRTTVDALASITRENARIEQTMLDADQGLNPLGLAADAVPFDIDPSLLAGRTGSAPVSHFQQVWERARQAVVNAGRIFDDSTAQLNILRQTQDSLETFQDEVVDRDRELRNRLIEIFGTPHEGNIGSGKAFPAGYNGPDLFFHAYVDVRDVNKDTVPLPPSTNDVFKLTYDGFQQQLLLTDPAGKVQKPANVDPDGNTTFTNILQKYFIADLGVDANPKDGIPDLFTESRDVSIVDSSALTLNLPIRAKGYAFQAPTTWGRRAQTGELQSLISDLVQAEADLALAIDDYNGSIDEMKRAADVIAAQYGIGLESLEVLNKGKTNFTNVARLIADRQIVANTFNFVADATSGIAEGVINYLPKDVIAGAANGGDILVAAKTPLFVVSKAVEIGLRSIALAAENDATFREPTLETENFDVAINDAKLATKFELQQQLLELKILIGDEALKRLAVFRQLEVLRQASDAYRTKLNQGFAVLDERAEFNRRTAGAVQEVRYQDMTFRVFRGEALEKYHAAFDLASRYVWLAGKAYDYETNLSDTHPGSAKSILEDVVKARVVGDMPGGQPMLGDGLAHALATLRDNYSVLQGQLGLNNAQSEDSKISLRHELFRKRTGSDTEFRAQLSLKRVGDLNTVPEFRRYCRPFAAPGGAQPGLVIDIPTQIIAGKNVFGLPLGPFDHAFDPTLFATKVNAVGVWFEGYDPAKFSTTPRVYLVPAGLDTMTIPDSPTLETRTWNVVDQRIPVPHAVGASPIGLPNWRPVTDTLDGPLGEIRKFSSFRAYAGTAGASVNTGEMTFDSRLTARSVWNTKWLLIIPGQTLGADASARLNDFLGATGIKDIHLVFKTFGYSGN